EKGALFNLDDWQDVSSAPDEPVPTNPVPTNPVPIDPTVPSPTDPVYPDDDEGQINFDVKKSGWNLNTNKKFYCHIWKYDGSPTSSGTDWLEWQVKKEQCSFDADTGIASFDLKKTGHNFDVSDGAVYCVIFSSNTGMQTFTAVMDGKCIGDTLYCTDERFESPEDSEKVDYDVRWVNNPNLGSRKRITSTGNIVGYSHCEGESDRTMVTDFVLRYYEVPEILEFLSGIIDKLNLTKGLVYEDVKQTTYDKVVSGNMNIYTREKVIAAVEKSLGVSPEFYVPGDVNLDGQITVTDATLIQKHLAGLNEFDRDKQLELADVNCDGAISIIDATKIQFILAGRYTAVYD
ncbi:MAG: dockerin type I domain-containing protein, partial [Ruminococcus sp.]